MITSHIVTPDMRKTEPFITGYASLSEARKALSVYWHSCTFECHNVTVLADTDGSRLVLQEVKQ